MTTPEAGRVEKLARQIHAANCPCGGYGVDDKRLAEAQSALTIQAEMIRGLDNVLIRMETIRQVQETIRQCDKELAEFREDLFNQAETIRRLEGVVANHEEAHRVGLANERALRETIRRLEAEAAQWKDAHEGYRLRISEERENHLLRLRQEVQRAEAAEGRCRTYNEIVTILFECDHGDEDMCGCRDKALTLMTTLRARAPASGECVICKQPAQPGDTTCGAMSCNLEADKPKAPRP